MLFVSSRQPRPAPIIAYVSNEKSNTVSVIDTGQMEVIQTIKVGQRPRGIEFTKDGKFVLVAVGDDDTIQMIDTKTNEIVGHAAVRSRSGAVRAGSRRQDSLRRQRERQHRHDHRHRRSVRGSATCRSASSRRAWAISPDGKILVNTSETTNMAHFIDTATRQIVANVLVDARPRFAEFKQRRLGAVGVVRDRRHRQRDRSGQARGDQEDHLRHPRPARARRSSRSASASPTTARPPSSRSAPPTASRWSTRRRIR